MIPVATCLWVIPTAASHLLEYRGSDAVFACAGFQGPALVGEVVGWQVAVSSRSHYPVGLQPVFWVSCAGS